MLVSILGVPTPTNTPAPEIDTRRKNMIALHLAMFATKMMSWGKYIARVKEGSLPKRRSLKSKKKFFDLPPKIFRTHGSQEYLFLLLSCLDARAAADVVIEIFPINPQPPSELNARNATTFCSPTRKEKDV